MQTESIPLIYTPDSGFTSLKPPSVCVTNGLHKEVNNKCSLWNSSNTWTSF